MLWKMNASYHLSLTGVCHGLRKGCFLRIFLEETSAIKNKHVYIKCTITRIDIFLLVFIFHEKNKKTKKKINSSQNTLFYIMGSSDLHFQSWFIRRQPISIWIFPFFPFTLTKRFAYRASPGVLSVFSLLQITLKINSMTLLKLMVPVSKDQN